MRFSIRQMLATVAILALVAAYVGQSIRYRNLATKYDHLEQRYAKAREMVKQLADVSITDEEKEPNRFVIQLDLPEGWPAGIKDELKDVPAGNMRAVIGSRLSGMAR